MKRYLIRLAVTIVTWELLKFKIKRTCKKFKKKFVIYFKQQYNSNKKIL